MARTERRYSNSITIGILVILAGTGLLLKSLGWIPNFKLTDYWPVILVVIGIRKMIFPLCRGSFFWGLVLAVVGGLLQAHNLNIILWRPDIIGAKLLILFGIYLVIRPFLPKRVKKCDDQKYVSCSDRSPKWQGDSLISDDQLDISLVMSGGKYICTGKAFVGGTVSLKVAGCEIDLTRVETELNEIFLDVDLKLGGIELRVPSTWAVTYVGRTVLGSCENRTFPVANPEKKLIIRGDLKLAGIEVRN